MTVNESISLKEHFTAIMKERDNSFNERFDALEKLINNNSKEAKEAVKIGLDAQGKGVDAAFAAANAAVQKAEIAAEKRYDNFADNYTKSLDAITKQVVELREFISGYGGKDAGRKEAGITLSNVILILIAIGALLINFLRVKP